MPQCYHTSEATQANWGWQEMRWGQKPAGPHRLLGITGLTSAVSALTTWSSTLLPHSCHCLKDGLQETPAYFLRQSIGLRFQTTSPVSTGLNVEHGCSPGHAGTLSHRPAPAGGTCDHGLCPWKSLEEGQEEAAAAMVARVHSCYSVC